MGQQSLQSNTTANNNTAVGYQAGYSNTTSNGSVFIGYQAGYNSNYTSGASQNTFVGASAGYNVTTGYNNTFVGGGAGYAAGYYVTTGSKNTILGAYSGNQGGLDIRTSSNYIVLSDGDGNPRLYCNASGGWTVPATNATDGFTVIQSVAGGYCFSMTARNNGGTYYYETFSAAGSTTGSITSNGTVTVYATTSDYRLKENVQPMTGALSKVNQLKPVVYDWISDKSQGQGFIAHELQAIIPDCVIGQKDAVDEHGKPVYQEIDTSFLVATLTAAIQELSTELNALKQKVGA
jgi:hypothetical protein